MKNATGLRALTTCAAAVLIAALIGGCNIFDFASDSKPPPTVRAEDAIREGNYDTAKEILAESVKDSTDSYALYLDAKATLHKAGVDIVKIVEIIEGQDNAPGGDLAILSIVDDLSNEEQTAWYKANKAVAANLEKIFTRETYGPFEPDDIALGFTISNMLTGVLGIRDTNQDGVIDDNDFVLDLKLLEDTEGFTFDGGMYEDESGDLQEFKGLEVFLGGFAAAKTVGKAAAGAKGYEPEDINKILGFVLHHLDNGTQSLISILNKNKTVFETEDIEDYLDQIAGVINFYWYNDGLDNDGDGYTDEELIDGVDNDGDGLIDEDSDYTDPAVVFGAGYDPFYNVDEKENVTTGESRDYEKIWEKWFDKLNKKNK